MKTAFSFRSCFSQTALGVALLVALPGFTGCMAMAAGAAGAGAAVAYVQGALESTVNSDFKRVVDSAQGAIKELEFAQVSENKDALTAVLVARTALDKKVEITITNSGKRLTKIKIRVGVFGDEALSLAILDKIKAGL